MAHWLHKLWYGKKGFVWLLLWPFSLIYRCIIQIRCYLYKTGIFKSYRSPAKVIIVGNETVGGGGKTPMVIALADLLQQQGKNVVVICKGYKGSLTKMPQCVDIDSHHAAQVGDEALLLKSHLNCPVIACQDRVKAAKAAVDQFDVDYIISDDGLTHYALQRDLEIILENDLVGLGNGSLLPAGPLRELKRKQTSQRLFIKTVSDKAATHNENTIYRTMGDIISLAIGNVIALEKLKNKKLLAVTAIAHPQAFFTMLKNAGLSIDTKAFKDHHLYTSQDLAQGEYDYILMTTKDAVKCQQFNLDNLLVVGLNNQCNKQLLENIQKHL